MRLIGLGADIPLVIAPAMHETMYEQLIVRANAQKLIELGVIFAELTEAEGKAKLAAPERILRAVIEAMPPRDYEGRRVLVTVGPTIEHIDPVRIITNPSTGKMDSTVAFEAVRRGALVTLVHGPMQVSLPKQARKIPVRSTEEMYEAVMKELRSVGYDVVVATAAPADYAPIPEATMIPTAEKESLVLELKSTSKIIDQIKRAKPGIFLVAFRAQTNRSYEALVSDAYARLKQVSVDLIAVNDIGRSDVGFGSDFNEVTLIGPQGRTKMLPRSIKRIIAREILTEVSKQIPTAQLS